MENGHQKSFVQNVPLYYLLGKRQIKQCIEK